MYCNWIPITPLIMFKPIYKTWIDSVGSSKNKSVWERLKQHEFTGSTVTCLSSRCTMTRASNDLVPFKYRTGLENSWGFWLWRDRSDEWLPLLVVLACSSVLAEIKPGKSSMISPDVSIIAAPLGSVTGILYADKYSNKLHISRRSFDLVGCYNRLDIFNFQVNRRPQTAVVFNDKIISCPV